MSLLIAPTRTGGALLYVPTRVIGISSSDAGLKSVRIGPMLGLARRAVHLGVAGPGNGMLEECYTKRLFIPNSTPTIVDSVGSKQLSDDNQGCGRRNVTFKRESGQ
ncbi:hypothetical protein MRX96_016654 [Rhipicephalus microplus]